MQIICHLFFIIFILVLFGKQKSASEGNEKDIGNEAIIDTKLVEEFDDDNDETDESEKPAHKKERAKRMKNFVGTNLFGEDGRKNCFSSQDIALLAARRDFESLIPKDLPNCLLDDELAKLLMQYFYGASQVIDKMIRGHSKFLAQKAFYDTLGGYLKHYMIPISKYSFYGGLVKLRTVQNILDLFSQSKEFLNTNGNGWRAPLTDFSDLDIQIDPLRIITDSDDSDTSCTQLDLLDESTGEDDDMIVTLPRLDPEENGLLQNIWLPFKRKRTFDLQSSRSSFVILRYFELTSRCYKFQKINQNNFNKRLRAWLLENVEVHLKDDVLYPGLGAILRIIETLRRKWSGSFVIETKTVDKRKGKSGNSKAVSNSKSENSLRSIFEYNSPAVGSSLLDEIEKEELCRRKKYIYIAIVVSACMVLIVFLVIGLTFCRKWPCRKPEKTNQNPQTEEPPKTGWLCCRKQPKEDDEVLLYSKKLDKVKSKKFSKKSHGRIQKPETTTCCGQCLNKSGPATIETSSMDSGSDKDIRNKQKSSPCKSKSPKAMVVNEKKRFNTFKKKDEKVEFPPSGRVGILKKGM